MKRKTFIVLLIVVAMAVAGVLAITTPAAPASRHHPPRLGPACVPASCNTNSSLNP